MLSGIEGQHSNPFSALTPTSQQHPRVNDRSPLGRRRRRAVVVVRRAFCLLNTRSSSSLSSPPPPTSSRPPRKSARPRRSAPSAGRTADGTDGRRDGPVAGVAVALDSTATDPSVAVVGLRADYCIGLEVGRTQHCMSLLSV